MSTAMYRTLCELRRVRQSKERVARAHANACRLQVMYAEQALETAEIACREIAAHSQAAAQLFFTRQRSESWAGIDAELFAQTRSVHAERERVGEHRLKKAREVLRQAQAIASEAAARWAQLNAAVENIERLLNSVRASDFALAEAREEDGREEAYQAGVEARDGSAVMGQDIFPHRDADRKPDFG
ncbi:hypothetical protein RGU70_02310 [Herbaspirillum sp. RTI4]|uniref:hypothetical protein n=1 Tax=Herbaspirillum sp. RTI4 TaxID=3048640 RepID=UPI002AB3FFF9|nr:hypothetical protein [Herbaspirillum sp. RTI4]MDY7577160.1 hypothetical protein [Herbaspirillum sp. RTI4]MEA9980450.1 hypothetical protein [Herbaspirillum sp. RTI4]